MYTGTGEGMREIIKQKRKSIISIFFALLLILSGVIIPAGNNTIYVRAEEDIYKLAEEGRNAAGSTILNSYKDTGYTFGDEWDIYSLTRAGIKLTDVEKDNYYASVVDTVSRWSEDQKPTDIERVIISLSALGYDAKNVGGVNLEEMLLSNAKLNEGSNELSFALIALDLSGSSADEAVIRTLFDDLIKFQNEDGGFSLFEGGMSGMDTTAMALQAVSLYKDSGFLEKAEDVIDNGLTYMKININTNTFDAGNSEATAQVILTLTSLGKDPLTEKGFSNESSNTVKALMDYYIEGQGFAHSKNKLELNKMATSQAFQALESFRRFTAGEPSFWEIDAMDTKPAPEIKPVPMPEVKPDTDKEIHQEDNKDVVTEDKKEPEKKEDTLKTKQNSGKKSSKKPSKKSDKKDKDKEAIVDKACTFVLSDKKGDINYTLKAVRTDEEKLEKLNLVIKKGSKDKTVKENIKTLAKDPFTFHFNTDKAFGADVLVEMETDLDNGEYLLMKYNDKEEKLELVQKVEVKEGRTKFVLDKGGDYCITEKASTESILDEEEGSFPVLPVSVVTGVVAIAIAVTIVSSKKKAKDNEK